MTAKNHTTQRSELIGLNDQAAQFARAFADFATGYQRFMNNLAEVMWPYFEAASRIDWAAVIERLDAGVKRHIEAGRKLASKGWTIPGWIYLSELIELSEMPDSEIDDHFTTAYCENNYDKVKTLSASLVLENRLAPWKTLIEEITECIISGKHQVTIPALLSILEGYTIRNIIKPEGSDARNVRLLAQLKKQTFNGDGIIASIPAIPWISASTFLENLFKNAYFDEPAPSFINRHWILHGRSEIDWKVADALRLLTALHTLSWAQSFLDAGGIGKAIL